MPSDSADRFSPKPQNLIGAPVQPPPSLEQDPEQQKQQQQHHHQLQCPRCDSNNTKFCYYNNYNLSQPRHFCKSCRRYWTHGGTLRNIPIGGGTRRSAKRSRITTPSTATTTASSSTSSSPTTTTTTHHPHPHPHHHNQNPFSATPISSCSSDPLLPLDLNAVDVNGGFTSLLHSQATTHHQTHQGFLALGGFGLGLGSGIGSGFEDLGSFEIGRGVVWPSLDILGGAAHAGVGGGGGGGGGATWQLGNGGDVGFGDGSDCFAWPELTISTPRKGVK